MTSKITQQARQRCAAHTLQEQLEQVREAERQDEYRRRNGANDQNDITAMLEADMAWSGQHARLTMPISGAD